MDKDRLIFRFEKCNGLLTFLLIKLFLQSQEKVFFFQDETSTEQSLYKFSVHISNFFVFVLFTAVKISLTFYNLSSQVFY